eukprot:TRINITY_DN1257_c1_g1_i3.p1 TRINITY_DN1257_c1_g1~~TRINITY_DN1257_c1_g1_i3.p1  ORF type:complete len:263 (+),score=21.29 TRINITY_DN1257_c1_g1_i3:96-884(+)
MVHQRWFSSWLLIAVFCGLALGQDVGNRVLSVNGYGLRAMSKVFEAWAAGYQFHDDFATISYDQSKGSTDSIAVISDPSNPYIFGTIEYAYIGAARNASLKMIPYFFYGITFPFHLDGVEEEIPVYLTEEVLCEIYVGRISQWDDSAIQDLNPNVTMPSTTIRPVIYNESSSANLVFSTACSEILGDWNSTVFPPVGPVTSYPIDNNVRTLTVDDDPAALMSLISTTDGAIGFAVGADVYDYTKREIILKRYDSSSAGSNIG